MADDRLMFPIGFDLDTAVKDAGNEWNSTYYDKLNKIVQKKPLVAKIKFDTKQLDNLDDVRKRLQQLKLQPVTPETKSAIQSLVKELKSLEKILEKIDKLNKSAAAASSGPNAVRAARIAEIQNRDAERAAINRDKARQAAARAAREEARLEQAVRRTGNAYKSTEGYIERLIKRSLVLFGWHQVTRFAQKLREVTAEFELQRVSLGAIIQDQERANALFSQIKTFAVQSPFEIKDLVGYVKQLSAYRIETEKLFDTTKRLADVSAGLGTDMGRLILAYGQVRAASVLRGQELRQFTETGIPLVELLAEKFTALRGEVVSTSEVFDLISQRAVSFKMVEEIFNDLTNAGGMFYNMQEKQAQTLAGQWSNLKDSLSVMYDEMGRTEVIRGAMEGIISTTKSLASNWRTVYQVVEGSATAIAAMVLVQKNATVSSAALTAQEAIYNAVKKQQIRQIPAWIAGTKMERSARLLSIAAAKAHTHAMIKQATATNVLSRAFWKLTAAMLANPWVLAAGAIAGATYALIKLVKNAETAEDRMKKLNNAVGSMQSYENKMKPLIDSYNELSTKVERTAAEEKKLKAVTKELASAYPGAISAVKKYGDEVEIAANKVNALYEAESKARREAAQRSLEQTEKDIEKAEKEIERLQSILESGTKTVTSGGGMFGGAVTYETALTDKDKKKILEQINEIRTGKKDGNGDGGLVGLINAATEAKRALGLIGTEAEENINAFGSWKKTLQDFSREVETSLGTNASIRLFDDNQIDNFKSLDDALKDVAETYKTNIALVEQYNNTLASTSITDDERRDAKAAKDRAQALSDMAYSALKYYNALKLLDSKSGGSGDKRLSNLKEEISLLEKLYSKYKDYTQFISKTDAQERINREFGKTLEIFKKYGIELPKTSEEYQSALRKLQDVMRGLPDSQKDVLELGFKIENVDWEDTKNNLEKEIKRLADEVSRTKTAKEFFDKMLNMTGDQQLSATVTMSVYGDTGAGLQDKLIAQIRDAFKGIEDEQINLAIGVDSIDYKKLREIWDADKALPKELRKIPSEYDKTIQEILDNQEKANREWLLDTFKVYEDFRTFEEQRTAVVRRENEKRKKIEVSKDLSDEQKAKLKAASLKKEAEELNDIDWAEFKASDDWIKTFENMDRVATPTIERLIKKLREFIDANKDLTPEQLKTVMGEYNKLYEELIQRNPFKAIIDGISDYKASLGELANARTTLAAAQGNLETAQQGVEMAKATGNADMLAQALRRLAEAEKMVEEAESDVTEAQDDQKESFAKLQKGMQGVSSLASNLQSIFSQVFDLFGIAEDSELGEYLQDVAKALGIVSAALGVVASMLAIVDALGAPIFAIVAAVAALGAGLMFLANTKVRRANREIEKQQEIIDALSYSYGRLQKAAENVFSSEFVSNFRKQQENLRAQIEAVEKQLAAEESKGKKTDNEKVKEYQESIRELKDELSDLYGTLSAQFLGSDLTSAARTFAQSWLDAYKEFGDTRKAIEGEMRSMMENLIVEAALGSVMQQALKDVFDMIENMNEGDFYNDQFWSDIVSEMAKATDNATAGADAMMKKLEAAGVNIRDLGSDFTGISKDIASASEESILGLTSLINTSLYYVSNVDRNVAQIVAIMQGGGYELTSGEQMSDLVTLQNQHLAHLPQIAANTAATAERCERAAQACEAIAANLDRVIKPNGVAGNYRVNTSLSS